MRAAAAVPRAPVPGPGRGPGAFKLANCQRSSGQGVPTLNHTAGFDERKLMRNFFSGIMPDRTDQVDRAAGTGPAGGTGRPRADRNRGPASRPGARAIWSEAGDRLVAVELRQADGAGPPSRSAVGQRDGCLDPPWRPTSRHRPSRMSAAAPPGCRSAPPATDGACATGPAGPAAVAPRRPAGRRTRDRPHPTRDRPAGGPAGAGRGPRDEPTPIFPRLDSVATMRENAGMEVQGRVANGVVILEGGLSLPEGTLVTVSYPGAPPAEPPEMRRPVQLPLVQSDRPGSRRLTAERIAELLEDEDVPA